MNKRISAACAVLAAVLCAGAAQAHDRTQWSVTIGSQPRGVVVPQSNYFYGAPPSVYTPPPAILPPPVYVQPPPVYGPPPVIYMQPGGQTVYVNPPVRVVPPPPPPGYWHDRGRWNDGRPNHWHGSRDGRWDGRWDGRDHYRR